MYVKMLKTEFGILRMESDGESITRLKLSETESLCENTCPVLDLTSERIKRYLSGEPIAFSSIPLNPEGTEFEKSVWRALLCIPRGETRTYGQIAKEIQNERACRAVGRACAKNPIWILIPCHRAVGAGGLTGYAGGIDMKKRLLALERNYSFTNSSAI